VTLDELNRLPVEEAWRALQRCCGAEAWVEYVCGHRPYADRAALERASKLAFDRFKRADWLEAFSHHPKIGDPERLKVRFRDTSKWSGEEQSGVADAGQKTLEALARGNRVYEDRFGFAFIVSATGKGADEMLSQLEARLENEPGPELFVAADEVRKITAIRLDKMLAP
jgi:2-oxo-4-hydroxy-4-carboxy-5-ureidoimidazoline decarboxylase